MALVTRLFDLVKFYEKSVPGHCFFKKIFGYVYPIDAKYALMAKNVLINPMEKKNNLACFLSFWYYWKQKWWRIQKL